MALTEILQKPKITCRENINETMYNVVCDIRKDTDASYIKLNIKQVSKHDIGDWTCTDQFDYGHDENWAFLNITQKPGGIGLGFFFVFCLYFLF